jgi:hypothetical protein
MEGNFNIPAFPTAVAASLYASKSEKEAAMRLAQQQQLVQGFHDLGAGINSIVERRKTIADALLNKQQQDAQASLLMQDPAVQKKLGMVQPPTAPVATVGASPAPVTLAQTASPDASGNPIPNFNPAPGTNAAIPANMEAMRQKLALSLRGTKADDLMKFLKPDPMVQQNILNQDANGAIVGSQSSVVPKGTITKITKPILQPGNNPGAQNRFDVKQQDALEKQYRDMLLKTVSNRSGGLAVENAKVDLARHLRQGINASYNKETGEFVIPPSMHTEVALGLAKMMSSTGVVPIQLEEQLRQKTLREAAANIAIYFGLDPAEIGGTPQSVSKYFIKMIDRQGQTAEENRQGYIDNLHEMSPSELDPVRRDRLDKVKLGNSFNALLDQSPDRQSASNNPQPANPDLIHLSTKDLLDMKKKMTAHKESQK